MAKTTKRKKEEAPKGLVIQEINQINVDRTAKDISTWRDAHKSAESVYYPNRSRLLDLYADVDLDGHLTGVWDKRRSSATNKDIAFVDASGKEVEAISDLMETEEWHNLLDHVMDSKMWGLSGIQFLPGATFNWEEIPRKHILIEKSLIKKNQSDQEGISYKEDPLVWVIGRKNDLGLMLKCSFYALIKKGNFADWAQYVEIFGQPVRVIKYDAFDDKTRIQLKQVLDDTGSSLAIMIPKQADFEIMDGKTSNGDGQLQERLKNACNNEMSVIILGNTETTGNDNGGSNAKAKEQGKQQLEITKKDIKFLRAQLNDAKFIKVLASYGYPVQGGRFIIKEEADPYRIQAQVNTIATLREMGTPVEDEYVYELTGIPKPKDYDKQKKAQEANEARTKEDTKPHLNSNKTRNKQDLSNKVTLSWWRRFRTSLADFFDQAP